MHDPVTAAGPTLPARPRLRLVTPATAALAAVAIGGLGFWGGVEVQKGSGDAAVGGSAGGPPAAAGPRGAAGAAGVPTIGEVKSKRGSTLYVTTPDGATVKVRAAEGATITRTSGASVKGIYPGDSVIVEGKADSGGVVRASSLRASASAAAGGPMLLGGGGAPPGGGVPGAGVSGGGGAGAAPGPGAGDAIMIPAP